MKIEVPKKGSIEWVAFSDYYNEVADTAEQAMASETDELIKSLSVKQVGKIRGLAKRLEGVKLGVKNLGRREVQKYSLMYAKLKADETKELVKLRKGVTREQAPEYWANGNEMVTPDGKEASMNLARQIVVEFVDGIQGVELKDDEPLKESGENPERIADLLEYMGLSEEAGKLILGAQGLKTQEVFS